MCHKTRKSVWKILEWEGSATIKKLNSRAPSSL